MGSDVNDCEHDDGPSGGLVKGDIFIKRNELVKRCLTK